MTRGADHPDLQTADLNYVAIAKPLHAQPMPWIKGPDRNTASELGEAVGALRVIRVAMREQYQTNPCVEVGSRGQHRTQVTLEFRSRVDDDTDRTARLEQQPGVRPVQRHRSRIGGQNPGCPADALAGHEG